MTYEIAFTEGLTVYLLAYIGRKEAYRKESVERLVDMAQQIKAKK